MIVLRDAIPASVMRPTSVAIDTVPTSSQVKYETARKGERDVEQDLRDDRAATEIRVEQQRHGNQRERTEQPDQPRSLLLALELAPNCHRSRYRAKTLLVLTMLPRRCDRLRALQSLGSRSARTHRHRHSARDGRRHDARHRDQHRSLPDAAADALAGVARELLLVPTLSRERPGARHGARLPLPAVSRCDARREGRPHLRGAGPRSRAPDGAAADRSSIVSACGSPNGCASRHGSTECSANP